jgi:nitrogen regulatory protein PII
MKEIKAIIQPFMLERVMNALHEIKDLPAVTISTAYGTNSTRSRSYSTWLTRTPSWPILPSGFFLPRKWITYDR